MAKTEITFSYFVIGVDYGRRGIEAIVDPEMTRAGAVEKVRELIGDGKEIAFAHFITMNEVPEDVKDRLIEAAAFDEEPQVIDLAAIRADHARDLRKHEVV